MAVQSFDEDFEAEHIKELIYFKEHNSFLTHTCPMSTLLVCIAKKPQAISHRGSSSAAKWDQQNSLITSKGRRFKNERINFRLEHSATHVAAKSI